jgi:hypothetical protein
MANRFAPSERRNDQAISVGPNLVGVSGDGGLGRGRTLVEARAAPIL